MGFTKQVKANWIKALESGEYTQLQNGYTDNHETPTKHCCLAVYDTVNRAAGTSLTWASIDAEGNDFSELIKKNDVAIKNFKPNYSNVLPLIKTLNTLD